MSRRYTRRRLLGVGGLTAIGSFAGCTIGWSGDADRNEGNLVPDLPQVENPPDAVYIPTHREAMRHLPAVEAGEYMLSPMITYPHSFWLVTGTEREEVTPVDGRGVHLMVTLWDAETGRVLPVDAGATMRVLKGGDLVDQRAPWPMISQTMGFHFGDNVSLPEDGTYAVEVDLNPIEVEKTGAFEGRFTERVTASFTFEYDDAFRRDVIGGVEYLDESYWGQRGALEPPMAGDHEHAGHGDSDDGGHDHEDHGHHDDDDEHHHDDGHHDGDEHHHNHGHDQEDERESNHQHGEHHAEDSGHEEHHHNGHHMPFSALPEAETYPGVDLGEHESGDARFVVRYLRDSRFADGGYLLVSPRTPYNRVPLADMALSVEGDIEADLQQTLDSELGLHYGASVELLSGDTFELVVGGPPQVSRHAGYETAFLTMAPMQVTVPE